MPANRANWTHPDLQSLTGLFYEDCLALGEFVEIKPENIPAPWLGLLAHTRHMTVTLEEWHQSPVELQVLEKRVTDTHYSRKIVLRRKSDQRIVLFGIVRLGKSTFPAETLHQIESESMPLGRVLIDHQIMRNVKLMSTWRIQPGEALQEALEQPGLTECFGRTALIYANGLPAVELLEIVA